MENYGLITDSHLNMKVEISLFLIEIDICWSKFRIDKNFEPYKVGKFKYQSQNQLSCVWSNTLPLTKTCRFNPTLSHKGLTTNKSGLTSRCWTLKCLVKPHWINANHADAQRSRPIGLGKASGVCAATGPLKPAAAIQIAAANHRRGCVDRVILSTWDGSHTRHMLRRTHFFTLK